MPSLSDKLKELGVQVGASNISAPPQEGIRQRLIDVFDGAWEETRRGECFVVRKSISSSSIGPNSKKPLSPDLEIFSKLPGLKGIANVPADRILFIDTETTGLSGGAGTYVFLIGAAKIIEGKIELAQFFLQDPAKEPAQLSALEQFSSSTELIVSYNGKSFDLPRIKTRFKYHGWQMPFSDVLHFDLLHIVRRLWKRHLPGCTLGDLEHHILGLERSSLDIPGWQVSEKFFEYLQTGNPDPLKGVFYHNEIDVVSLISLLRYIADRLSNPLSSRFKDQHDLISIGEYLIPFDEIQAVKVLKKALKITSLDQSYKISGLQNLARIHKRAGDYRHAIPLWKECANLGDPFSQIELAMYFEHKDANFEEAIHWTLSALEIYNSETGNLLASSKEAAEYRLARLIRKSEKQKP